MTFANFSFSFLFFVFFGFASFSVGFASSVSVFDDLRVEVVSLNLEQVRVEQGVVNFGEVFAIKVSSLFSKAFRFTDFNSSEVFYLPLRRGILARGDSGWVFYGSNRVEYFYSEQRSGAYVGFYNAFRGGYVLEGVVVEVREVLGNSAYRRVANGAWSIYYSNERRVFQAGPGDERSNVVSEYVRSDNHRRTGNLQVGFTSLRGSVLRFVNETLVAIDYYVYSARDLPVYVYDVNGVFSSYRNLGFFKSYGV